jgi:hypothetical protein
MFKNISQGFFKFFTKERVVILVIFLVLAWGLLSYSGAKSLVVDKMTLNSADSASSSSAQPVDAPVAPVEPSTPSAGYALQPVANPSDLLPVDQNSQWSALNPNAMTQGNVLMPDLLQAGYHIGLDTIGQTLRNANYQLRSDPIIPKADVGPWNNSTMEPDLARVPLEIGQGQR